MALDLSFESDLAADDELSAEERLADGEDTTSLDTMIFQFRASASRSRREENSVAAAVAPARTSETLASPPARRNDRYSRLKPPEASKSFGASADSRSRLRRSRAGDSDDETQELMSPMPKLTQIPKPKPSLLLASTRLKLQSNAAKPQERKLPLQLEKAKPLMPASPSRGGRRPSEASGVKKKAVVKQQVRPPSPLSSLSSLSPSPVSSIANENEGQMSIDDLIGQDLRDLNRLISSGRERIRNRPAPAPAKRSLRRDSVESRSDRPRRPSEDHSEDGGAAIVPLKLLLPPSRITPKHRSLHRVRLQRKHGEGEDEPPPPPPSDEDDSFAEEIRVMRRQRLKEQEQKPAVEIKAQADKEKPVPMVGDEIDSGTTASIREASHAIDQALLLALQPFEKRKKEQEQDEQGQAAAAVAAEEARTGLMSDATLTLAAQTIVEQLDRTFEAMTQQRVTELKAEDEAAAAVKAAEEAKQKAAEEAKAAKEREVKQQESEILSLIPLKGKLLTSSEDVEEALLRLEYEETKTRNLIQRFTNQAMQQQQAPAPERTAVAALHNDSPENALMSLREMIARRMGDIEERMSTETMQRTDEAYHTGMWMVPPQAEEAQASDEEDGSDELENDSMRDILKRDVVEKLDLTIMKLRHMLSVDAKEAAEADVAKKQQEAAKKKKQQEEEKAKQQLEEEKAQAEAARKRVMGLSSLDQLGSWVDEYRQLRTMWNPIAPEFAIPEQESTTALPSFFDNNRAMERFDGLQQLSKAVKAPAPESNQQPLHRVQHPEAGEDNQSEDVESGAFIAAASVARRRFERSLSPHKRMERPKRANKGRPKPSRTNSRRPPLSSASHLDCVAQTIHVLQTERRNKRLWIAAHNDRYP